MISKSSRELHWKFIRKVLDLHRASAGSGKTYTLAKKYIWYLITISPEGAPRRLRTDAELADSAHHILAVTFTNKATNEMQLRIVDKLFELATHPAERSVDKTGCQRIVRPDYMGDFCDELGVRPERIASVCRKALSILLENYSDFKVSTIDSFFQLVLRTFAYESELNDAYQVELDSEFLSQVGVDGTLEEIDANSDDRHTPYWISKLMDRDEKKWNIFKREIPSGKTFSTSPYADFIDSVKRLENEEFKLIRDEEERYFESNPDFIRLYEDLSRKYESPVREAFANLKRVASNLYALLPDEFRAASGNSAVGRLVSRIKKLATAPKSGWSRKPDADMLKYLSDEYLEGKTMAKALSNYDADLLTRGVLKCGEAFTRWENEWNEPLFSHWRLYSVNLPYLALFSIASRKRREYLNETNAVELGETSMILRGVIGDSDAPFIYERLGTYLNHFLIDEFQDTSRLQWENLRPLLVESMSRDNDNLIIGDAKQSIYRFRNADPSLITSVVPDQFGTSVRSLGSRPEENTNYRSRLRVVQFNNSFFEYLVSRLDREAALTPGRRLFGELYGNVVQTPFKTAAEGYVELRLPGEKQKDFRQYVLRSLPELVTSLVRRGYRQKDIAVLVSRNSEGEAVIGSFVDYNANRNENEKEIRFVSEQSLKVANSGAVKIVLGVLENMARGFNPEIREGEESRLKGVGTWVEMESGFKFFAMGREGEPMEKILDDYIAERPDMSSISAVLDRLQSLAIPAIVEAVVASFIPAGLRRRDAVFIAAFQDLVLEYCDGHPTDIGSFLKWWERKKRAASISSPEDTDAVQVLTVHKSKGLEYDCVIVPFADWDMKDGASPKREWRWVRPRLVEHDEIEMPPYIPVETSSEMEGTAHADLLYEYYDMLKMDALNSAYVAFTRAGRELYIFSNDPYALTGGVSASRAKRKTDDIAGITPEYFKMGKYLFDFAEGIVDRTGGSDNADHARLEPDTVSVGKSADGAGPCVVTVGERPEYVVAKHEDNTNSVIIGDYVSVVSDGEELKYRQGDLPAVIEAGNVEDDEDPADLDPRSEGNLKHAVLEHVRVPSDLHKAVRHLCVTGLMPLSLAAGIETTLAAGLATPTVARWFDGNAKVITERPILKAGQVSRRPDRIVVFDDGHAEVVDYKFGKYDEKGKYRRQIRGYVRRLAETGLYTRVEGYLWYVNENIIEKV